MSATTLAALGARAGERIFARGAATERYSLRLASSTADVHSAQSLRFLVFNLELGHGLDSAFSTLRDEDPFDAVCDHLIVEERATGEIVGGYRLQTGANARRNLGFYSASEFDLEPLAGLEPVTVELGRACVHSQHRNLATLGLLWKGISDYAQARGCRFLIGCSSLNTVDAKAGATAYRDLSRSRLVAPRYRVQPLPELACPLEEVSDVPVRMPRLIGAYLAMGARICGAPAIDHEFGTIDFLTFMDLNDLPAETVERYLR